MDSNSITVHNIPAFDTEHRYTIRLMPEYGGVSGLWHKGMPIEPIDIPISLQLAAEIQLWNDYYDENCDDYKTDEGFVSTFDYKTFSERGRELAIKLKQELGELYKVVYFDEYAAFCQGENSEFMYEITNEMHSK